MTPPLVTYNDPMRPYSQHAALRIQIGAIRQVHVMDWLQEMDLSTVIETWWSAQAAKAQEIETRRQQDAQRAEHDRQRAAAREVTT